LSENITVRSILGRFLEHSRLYFFEAGDRTAYYLGSADVMPRNLDHRVEVVTPIQDVAIQAELAATLDTLLADNTTAWELQADGTWQRARGKKDDRARSAQATMMRRARRRVSLARSR
jgi:polyphosphate kinase